MLLNFFKLFHDLISFQFIFFVSSLLFKKYYEAITTYDITARTNLNVFFWDLMYFSWTNISYIFTILVPSLLLTYALRFSDRILIWKQVVYSAMLVISVIYITLSISACIVVNYSPCKLDYYNILLINGLNKYHPFILYASWVLLLAVWLTRSLITLDYKLHERRVDNSLKLVLLSVNFIIFTLMMGSWWAYQEGSWGGWWNWDPSEVFGLYIMIALVHKLHNQLIGLCYTLYSSLVAISLVSSLAYYCFMQVNFSLISHNFGFRDSDFVDIRVFYSLLILVITLLAAKSFSVVNSTRQSFIFFGNKITYSWHSLITLSLVVSIISLSLFSLVNDLAWKVMKLNINNVVPDYRVIILTVILAYLPLFYKVSWATTSLLLYLVFVLGIEALLLPIAYATTQHYVLLHAVILFAIIWSILWGKFIVSSWLPIKLSTMQYISNTDFVTNPSFSVQYPFISESFLLLNQSTYTAYLSSTAPEIKTFFLPLTTCNTCQALVSDHTTGIYTFLSNDKSAAGVLSLVLLYLYMLLVYVYKPKSILI
jgi:cytochrome c biogenesis factor